MKTKDRRVTHTVAKVESHDVCFVCGGAEHLAQDCPTYSEMRGIYEEQCNALGMYKKPYSPYSETYNPNWRNHPNFSWKSDQQANNQWKQEQQAPKSYVAPQYNARPTRNSLEDTLQAFMEAQSKTNKKFETILTKVID